MRTVSQVSVHMSHYAAFGDNERQCKKRHVNLDLAPESCICILKLTRQGPSKCGLTHVMFRNGIPTRMKQYSLGAKKFISSLREGFDTTEKNRASNWRHARKAITPLYTALFFTS